MRFVFAIITLLLCTASTSFAQATGAISIGLDLRLLQGYIQGEDIPAEFVIKNNTSRNIILNDANSVDRLTLSAQRHHIHRLGKTQYADLSKIKPFIVPGGRTFRVPVYLNQVLDFNQHGKYMLNFAVNYRGKCYSTSIKTIDIVNGYVVLEGLQLFNNQPNTQRKISLLRWSRNHVDCLFIRIADTPKRQAFTTTLLGAYLGPMKPKMNIADNGEVTVLHKATPDYYVKNTFWSLPNTVSHRDRVSLLDPNAASANRMKSLQGDMNSAFNKAANSDKD